LGPLTWIYQCFSSSKFIVNFYGSGSVSIIIVLFGMVNSFVLGYGIWKKSMFFYTDANCLSYVLGLVFLSIIGASLNGYIHKKIPRLLETVELSGKSEEVVAPLFVDLTTKEELKRTILRLNFDASSLFMSFLENVGDQFKRKIQEQPDENIEVHEDRLISSKPVNPADIIAEAVDFEDSVFNHKFLRNPSRHDKFKSHGYTYAERIVEQFDDSYGRVYLLILFGFVLINKVGISFLKLDFEEVHTEGYFRRYIMTGFWMLLNAVVTLVIFIIVYEGVQLLLIRLNHVEGMKELISLSKPDPASLFRKDCSMINIFDFESLRTWASLRMVFMNMNERRLESTSLAVSIILGLQLLIILTLGFFYFTVVDDTQKERYLHYVMFFGAESAIYIIASLLFVWIGSQVNKQYQEHIYVLKEHKTNIYTLFKLYPIMAGDDGIQPSTYIYARGVKHLRRAFGDQEVTPEALGEKLSSITDAYDTIIAELETEEQNFPLKILGVPMTDSFVTTIVGTIFTIAAIPITKYLSDLTGWG